MLDFSQQQLAHSYPHLVQLTCLGPQVTEPSYNLDKVATELSGHKPTGKAIDRAYLELMTELGSTSKVITLKSLFYRSDIK